MGQKILISEIFKTAGKSLFKQFWVLAGLLIGYTIISFLLTIFIAPTSETPINATTIVLIILWLTFSLLFSLGYTKNLFQALDSEEPQFSAYGRESRHIIVYFIATIIYLIVVAIGLALFIIPGIYLAIRLQFYQAAIVDDNCSIITSLKRSWEITKNKTFSLLKLFFTMLLTTIIGTAFLIIGLFVTTPLTGLMYCSAYRKLTAFSGSTDSEQD